jgi:integrase
MTDYLAGELLPVAHIDGHGEVAVNEVPLQERLRSEWLLSKRSDNTRAAYGRDLDVYLAWADEFDIDALRPPHVALDGYRQYLRSGGTGRNLADSSVARMMSGVSSFFRFCQRRYPHLVPGNPMDAIERVSVPQGSATVGLTREQARRVCDVAEQSSAWDHAVVRILLHTGVRVSELVNAGTWDLRRIGDDGLALSVLRKGSRPDRVRLPVPARDALAAYLAGRTGPLLLGYDGKGRADRHEVYYRLRLVGAAAGVSGLHPHQLRHTAATLALRAKNPAPITDIQKMLGHAQLATTQLYAEAAEDAGGRAIDVLAAELAHDPERDGEPV